VGAVAILLRGLGDRGLGTEWTCRQNSARHYHDAEPRHDSSLQQQSLACSQLRCLISSWHLHSRIRHYLDDLSILKRLANRINKISEMCTKGFPQPYWGYFVPWWADVQMC